jgi:hypothetical protein
MRDQWDFAAEFEVSQTGRGTAYMPANAAQQFVDYVAHHGGWIQSMEAFEVVGGREILDLTVSIKGLRDQERSARGPALNQLAERLIADAMGRGNPFVFKMWVDLLNSPETGSPSRR